MDRRMFSRGAGSVSYLTTPGEGTPVVLVHGMSLEAADWIPVAEAVGRRPWLALDLPGHGLSEHQPAYSHISDCEALVAFLSEVAGPAVVVGHSRGGQVGGLAAALRPDLVLGLFLEDVTPLFFEEARNRDLPFIRSVFRVGSLSEQLQQEGRTAEWLSVQIAGLANDRRATIGDRLPAAAIARWATAASRMDAAMFGAKGSFGPPPLSSAEQLARITCPLHLAHGDEESGSIVTASEREWLFAGHGDATSTRYAGAGHMLHAERQVDFAADLGAFLDRVP